MDDVETVARAVRPRIWNEDGLSAAERKQTPAMQEIAKTDALRHITAYKAWLRSNGWAITRRELNDEMKSAARTAFRDEAERALEAWHALLSAGEMKVWRQPES